MEKQHTPGPWKLYSEPFSGTVSPSEDRVNGKGWDFKNWWIVNDKDEILAQAEAMTSKGFVSDFNQFEANAKLIAASPMMFDFIQKLREEGCLPDSLHLEANEIISKAIGEPLAELSNDLYERREA
jgi:hypothetical protein